MTAPFYDPEDDPEFVAQAEKAMGEIERGEVEMVLLQAGESEGQEGYTIQAHPDVVDFLLSDPEAAADFMDALNEHLEGIEE